MSAYLRERTGWTTRALLAVGIALTLVRPELGLGWCAAVVTAWVAALVRNARMLRRQARAEVAA